MMRTALFLSFAALLAACAQVGADSSASAGATSPDALLMRDMAQANLAEMAAGELAVSKAASPLVREYGRQTMEDHRQLLDESRKLAAASGMPLPKSANLKHGATIDKLKSLSGKEFDRAYMEEMVQNHARTMQVLQRVADEATDPALRAHAQKAMPHVQAHLDIAKRITAELDGKGS